jgi:hypothetical protein
LVTRGSGAGVFLGAAVDEVLGRPGFVLIRQRTVRRSVTRLRTHMVTRRALGHKKSHVVTRRSVTIHILFKIPNAHYELFVFLLILRSYFMGYNFLGKQLSVISKKKCQQPIKKVTIAHVGNDYSLRPQIFTLVDFCASRLTIRLIYFIMNVLFILL